MKLEAFHGRGNDDVMSRHDLEDLITVVDGRAEIVADLRVAAPDVRSYALSETDADCAGVCPHQRAASALVQD
jgi:hypothetical protein